ncbi:hypothetical protein [Muribaculum sp.]|uniref:hypothetical protein n=1 Tax=Muribaculum sp. TaxID=1918611 RepID=UPI0023D517C6|nr:hypothetical protein [Muribaculum sp.]MDE5705729.1 hypothetical protein [Muribaculum sp.]MDE5922889.1 hypothetical protein [Muribaculum sp.]
MDTIWAFLSSLLTGVGAALALTVGVALLLHYVARASWIANALLSFILFVLSTFQFVLLFGAEAVRGYAELAMETAQIASGIADSQTVETLVNEVPGMADYVEVGKQGLEDTSVTIQQLVDDVLSGYIWRRRLWIAAFTSAVVIAGFFIPSRRRSSHKASLSTDMYGGGGYSSSSSSSSLNF